VKPVQLFRKMDSLVTVWIHAAVRLGCSRVRRNVIRPSAVLSRSKMEISVLNLKLARSAWTSPAILDSLAWVHSSASGTRTKRRPFGLETAIAKLKFHVIRSRQLAPTAAVTRLVLLWDQSMGFVNVIAVSGATDPSVRLTQSALLEQRLFRDRGLALEIRFVLISTNVRLGNTLVISSLVLVQTPMAVIFAGVSQDIRSQTMARTNVFQTIARFGLLKELATVSEGSERFVT
jgi:hypothetical protein